MLYSVKNIVDLKTLNELVSLQKQVKAVRLQDNLGKQNFDESIKKLYEPITDTIKDISRVKTETLMESYKGNKKTNSGLKEKVLELMNDKGMITPFLASSLVNFFKLGNKSQFKLIKDPNSIMMNAFLMNGSIAVTLYSNMLTFRDSNKAFKLDGDLFKTMAIYKFNVTRSHPKEQKINYEFGEKMKFIINQVGRKSDRVELMFKLLKLPAIGASGISTKFLLENPNELCDRIKI